MRFPTQQRVITVPLDDTHSGWAVGAGLTIADFVLYDVVDQARALAHGALAAGGHRCVALLSEYVCVCVCVCVCGVVCPSSCAIVRWCWIG